MRIFCVILLDFVEAVVQNQDILMELSRKIGSALGRMHDIDVGEFLF